MDNRRDERVVLPSAQIIGLAGLLISVIAGTITFKLLPPGTYWICVGGAIVVVLAMLQPKIAVLQLKIAQSKKRRSIRHQFSFQVHALCDALRPMCEPTVVFSAGNILNQGLTHQLLKPPCVRAYQVTLSVLFDRTIDLAMRTDKDVGIAMHDIHQWLSSYLRICDEIANELKLGFAMDSPSQGIGESFQRDWSTIEKRATTICDEYMRLAYGIRAVDSELRVPDYLPMVAKLG